uniref:Putative secreted protein n=1 Tax=Anopheles darlingi TaxID=43151 RepID=A0A2M4DG30_ANODA
MLLLLLLLLGSISLTIWWPRSWCVVVVAVAADQSSHLPEDNHPHRRTVVRTFVYDTIFPRVRMAGARGV